jgi:NAD(P)H dehydrogenase (quinone)
VVVVLSEGGFMGSSPIKSVLVVHAHPHTQSLSAAIVEAATRGLRSGGKTVELIDLYAEGFRAAMSREERLAYESDCPISDPMVSAHAELLTNCDALVMIYPTWNMGFPAVMKGWCERVCVPGVAFRLDESGKLVGNLGNLQKIVGITTYGSSRLLIMLAGDVGRRMLLRCLRYMVPFSLGRRTKWIGLYGLNKPDKQAIETFLLRVEHSMSNL